jgi:hypothetical protein
VWVRGRESSLGEVPRFCDDELLRQKSSSLLFVVGYEARPSAVLLSTCLAEKNTKIEVFFFSQGEGNRQGRLDSCMYYDNKLPVPYAHQERES